MMIKIRRIIQIVFLIVFITLVVTGKIQAWMGVFAASLVLTVMFGRFYCGFICPTNTMLSGMEFIYKRTGIKQRKVPDWVKPQWVRYGILALFILTFALTVRTGKKLPVLPVLTAAGVAVSLFFIPSLWHRYLCPYGTLMNIGGSITRHCWKVDEQSCSGCGACLKVCPADAIRINDKEAHAEIQKSSCLECTACAQVCPKDAIKYI
jgi:polyferredoxin